MTTSDEAMSKFWDKLDHSPFVMIGLAGTDQHSEPMTARFDVEYPNTLFFYLRKDNRLITGLSEAGSVAMAQYESKGHDLFACLRGRLSVCTSPSLIERFWSNAIEAWFDKGKQDPALEMLRFDIDHAELWLADKSVAGKLKMLFGGTIDRSRAEDKHVTASL